MSIYRVYLPPEAEGNFSENFRLIPDGKAIFALIAPPLWLIWHKLWLPLLAYFTVVFGISLLFAWQPSPMVGLLSALPGLYLLLEGRELIVGKLTSKGWREVTTLEAQNREEAEIKYIISANEVGLLTNVPDDTVKPPKRLTAAASGPSIGLFPE